MLFYNSFHKNYPLIYRISNLDISEDLSVTEVGYNRVPPGLYQTHKRDVYILHYIENGKGVFMNTPFGKKDGYLVIPKEVDVIVADEKEPYESYWIMFRGNIAPEILGLLNMNHNCVFPFKYNKECIELIKEALFYEHYNNEYEEAYNLQSVLFKILALHTKNIPIDKESSPSIAQKVAGYIEKNYFGPVSIATIAKNFHISRNYLYTLFKKEYGVSPQEYLILFRIEKAKRLLKNNRLTLSMKEISATVGFDNPLYFSRLFKNRTGMSPSEYRKKH